LLVSTTLSQIQSRELLRQPRQAEKFMAAVAADKFGWLASTPIFFGSGGTSRFRLAAAAGFGG